MTDRLIYEQGASQLRTVITHICNSLMSASISNVLLRTDGFIVHPIGCGDDVIDRCRKDRADVVLLEAAYNPGFTFDERLAVALALRRIQGACKVIIMCDENSAPELADRVALAKRDGLIDGFVYSSVSESYLAALLDAI